MHHALLSITFYNDKTYNVDSLCEKFTKSASWESIRRSVILSRPMFAPRFEP